MDIIRKTIVDGGYDLTRNSIFNFTKNDPELAHELFIDSANLLTKMHLEKLLLDNSANKIELPFEFSNAAGFNKNGDISPAFLKYLGFNRIEVGTVTNDKWGGNPKAEGEQRIWRFSQTQSIVNWLGLPGVGSKRVAENLDSFGKIEIPISINLMATPKFNSEGKIVLKQGDEVLRDLEATVLDTSRFCDRYVLNISCPNTHSTEGKKDARSQYQIQLVDMLKSMINFASEKDIYVKVSPDLNIEGVFEILDVLQDYRQIRGIIGTNTTTKHNPSYISNSPGKGGASGRAVKDLSMTMQEYFIEETTNRNLPLRYISVGGIDSVEEAGKRLEYGASGIQLYTGLIYKGPRLVREIRDSSFLRSYKPNEFKF